MPQQTKQRKVPVLMEKISKKFPYVSFTVFETVLMNNFLNHLIAQNTIFLQVERESRGEGGTHVVS